MARGDRGVASGSLASVGWRWQPTPRRKQQRRQRQRIPAFPLRKPRHSRHLNRLRTRSSRQRESMMFLVSSGFLVPTGRTLFSQANPLATSKWLRLLRRRLARRKAFLKTRKVETAHFSWLARRIGLFLYLSSRGTTG